MPARIPVHRTAVSPPRERRPDNDFYSSSRWRKLRAWFLRRNPLCEDCHAAGRLTPANEVHHRVDRAIDRSRQWDTANLVGLCKSCHSRRTIRDHRP